MRIGIAIDHGGFAMNERIAVALKSADHEVTDFGAAGYNITIHTAFERVY